KLSGGLPLDEKAIRHGMKDVLSGMQTADTKNAEVEEEERLTAEKEEKPVRMEKRLEERRQKREEEDKQSPGEGTSGWKEKADGENPEMGSG
ncbi:hypothetical protein KUCAC02_015078, partial [Chaenocephalus aceratus]